METINTFSKWMEPPGNFFQKKISKKNFKKKFSKKISKKNFQKKISKKISTQFFIVDDFFCAFNTTFNINFRL